MYQVRTALAVAVAALLSVSCRVATPPQASEPEQFPVASLVPPPLTDCAVASEGAGIVVEVGLWGTPVGCLLGDSRSDPKIIEYRYGDAGSVELSRPRGVPATGFAVEAAEFDLRELDGAVKGIANVYFQGRAVTVFRLASEEPRFSAGWFLLHPGDGKPVWIVVDAWVPSTDDLLAVLETVSVAFVPEPS